MPDWTRRLPFATLCGAVSGFLVDVLLRGLGDAAWKSWRLHTLDVRMEHDRKAEAIPH
jgi:hypothetical protein